MGSAFSPVFSRRISRDRHRSWSGNERPQIPFPSSLIGTALCSTPIAVGWPHAIWMPGWRELAGASGHHLLPFFHPGDRRHHRGEGCWLLGALAGIIALTFASIGFCRQSCSPKRISGNLQEADRGGAPPVRRS